jgi:hypothetical protein
MLAAADRSLEASPIAGQEPGDREIFVEFGPVNAQAAADALPVSALLVGRPGQAWEVRQWRADLTAILHR